MCEIFGVVVFCVCGKCEVFSDDSNGMPILYYETMQCEIHISF